ncbi:zinc ABC transporter substrate-binding protein [filamentous cyanobacterium LEGE 11480]|uniref:Zinc ABC transporter substrate-binding protein n=1 Tax=Romeriopsis navalis LEGE 11480 TaxID=2777977 RepID=A0A928VM65_9CYAN|nr:zinc ABC transporter substrate-binding protein [Romeriopsis navalis]MBE9028927.1 zinc ABC transporter substrate-binding protein [Romeriopsis navalis LEGE 11480]
MRSLFSRLFFLATILTVVGGGFAGCSSSPTSSTDNRTAEKSNTAAQTQVVATYSVLCDLAERIAQSTAQINCLIEAGVDPHVYQVTPDDRKAIDTAKLVLYGGYGFEPGIIKLIASAPESVQKIAVHEQAVAQPLQGGHDHDHAKEEGHDHDHDHDKAKKSANAASAEADPHVWHNAQHGIAMVKVIQQQLTQASPENKAVYAKNAQQIIDRLTAIDTWIKTAIATIPAKQRKLVTTHEALAYYGAAYGIPIEGALQGISTDVKATPTRIKELVDDVKASQVPTVFTESTANLAMMQALAQDAQVKVSEKQLFSDGLGDAGSGAETYEKMLVANTKAIVEGLGGQPSPPPVP